MPINDTQENKRFHYRVKVKMGDGNVGEFIGDAKANCDENARRNIISTELAGGGQVLKITDAGDRKRQPGDWSKRSYKDQV